MLQRTYRSSMALIGTFSLASSLIASCGSATFRGSDRGGQTSKPAPTTTATPDSQPTNNPTATTASQPPQTPSKNIEYGANELFHIGDGRMDLSSCNDRLKQSPLKGTMYKFSFEVLSAQTQVHININTICGSDFGDSNFASVQQNVKSLGTKTIAIDATQIEVGSITLNPGLYEVMVRSTRNTSIEESGDNDDFLVGNILIKADKEMIPRGVTTE